MAQEWNHEVYKWLLAAVLAGTAWVPASASFAAGESDLSQGSVSGNRSAIVALNDLNELPAAQMQGITAAVQKGILSGYPDGSFRPQMNMTRMEFAVVLAKALQLAPVTDSTSFSDVKSNWASGYIEAVKRAGLMNGDANGKFNPNALVNREQLAAIFVRAIGADNMHSDLTGAAANGGDVSRWADAAVKTALALDLLPAGANGFGSSQPVNRADVAQLIMNVLQSEQRSASITAVNGDLVTVDGKNYMIGQQLKQLFKTDNLNALIGSTITFESLNHRLANLSAIELKTSGTEQTPLVFDAANAFSGNLTLSGDHIVVQGSGFNQINVQPGVTQIELQANMKKLIINTDQRLQIKGIGEIGQIQVQSPDSRIQLDERIVPTQIKLPSGVNDKQIIFGALISSTPSGTGGSTTVPSVNISDRKDNKRNHIPVVTRPLSDRSVTLGDDESMIELDGLFQAENGDALTYAAVSSDVYVADASIQHSRLRVHPNAIGTTRISVTAQDTKGNTAQSSFTYTVIAATYEQLNHIPLVLNIPSDLNLLAGMASAPISLSTLFSDPDDDVLSYTYTVDDTSVASAALTNGELVLSAHNAGTTGVTINASDGKGGSTYVRFNVQVQPVIPINHKPIVIRQMDNLTLSATDAVYSIDLSKLFSDPDGDPLVYDALVTMPFMVGATLTGNKLDLQPMGAGQLTIILRAFDPSGKYASQMFTVQVTVPALNNAPYIKQTPAPFSLGLLDKPYTLDLATIFGDQDHDTLSYTAISSNIGVLQTSVNGSLLTATPVGVGTSTLTLNVNDSHGGTNSVNVNVSIVKNGPFISELVWKDDQSQAIELYNPTTTPIQYDDLVLLLSNMNQTFNFNDPSVLTTKSTLVVHSNLSMLNSEGATYYGNLGMGNPDFPVSQTGPVTVKLYYKGQLMDIATFSADQTLRRLDRTVGNPNGFNSAEWNITTGGNDTDLGVYAPVKP
ncbi:S-layer homology domain-containing protein [Paenibacillus sp. SGZ-1009]|uniref:S-layer homology domain-containing protein n=1 Tax=Paenibacillus campi TaxID=3106031 RepID=UPI002B00057D|nr:S-layer homology domain-containing protein [Paenibacillus sp. SGZ-1009]